MKALLFFTLFLSYFFAAGQQFTSTIFFSNSEYALDAEDMEIISAAADFIITHKEDITLTELFGFTDSSASSSFNMKLSEQRVLSVQQALEKDLPADWKNKAVVKWYGETKPPGNRNLHYGKRCVDIVITYSENKIIPAVEPVSALFDLLRDPVQKFRIDPTRDTILSGLQGTIISIPANAFYIPKSCAGQPVDIILQESYDPASMIFNGMTTASGKDQLQTDGMVFLNAQLCNRILTVKEENPLTVMFPTVSPQEGMELFFGKKDANGIIDWSIADNGLLPLYNAQVEDVLSKYNFMKRRNRKSCPFFFCGLSNFFSRYDRSSRRSYQTVDYAAFAKYKDSICVAYHVKNFNQFAKLMEERRKKEFESKLGREGLNAADFSYYIAQTNRLGYMNCDKFYSRPENKITDVLVQVPPSEGTSVFFVFTSFKSMMAPNAQTTENYSFINVGIGESGYIVVIQYADKIPYMYVEKTKITGKMDIKPELKAYTAMEMKKELQQLRF